MRVLGLESGYPAVPLETYTLLVLPVAALATVVALALRQWPPAAVAALATVALFAVIAPRAIGGPDSFGGVPVRVMSSTVCMVAATPNSWLATPEIAESTCSAWRS